MKTYQEIKAEITKLQQQAQAARDSELSKVIEQIKVAIAEYGLTARDLGLSGGKGGRRAAATGRRNAKPVGGEGIAKYRNPATGETWTGRGRPPAWIASATDRDVFLIESKVAAPSEQAPAKKRGRRAISAVQKRAAPAKSGRKPGRPIGTGKKSGPKAAE